MMIYDNYRNKVSTWGETVDARVLSISVINLIETMIQLEPVEYRVSEYSHSITLNHSPPDIKVAFEMWHHTHLSVRMIIWKSNHKRVNNLLDKTIIHGVNMDTSENVLRQKMDKALQIINEKVQNVQVD